MRRAGLLLGVMLLTLNGCAFSRAPWAVIKRTPVNSIKKASRRERMSWPNSARQTVCCN